MADAAAIDAEAKKRAKRERLEAWRREQAKKKRQVSGDDDASSKKAKVSDTPTPPAGKFATTLGFHTQGSPHPPSVKPRVRLDAQDEFDDELLRKPHRRFTLDASTESEGTKADSKEDPLDAYMNQLEGEVQRERNYHSEVLTADDDEPDHAAVANEEDEVDIDSIRAEDILAMANRGSKKKQLPTVDHASIRYEPFRKAFYHAPEDVATISEIGRAHV